MAAALFGTLAWFFLIVPIVQSAWILSKGGRRLVGPHLLMASVSLVLVEVAYMNCTDEFSLFILLCIKNDFYSWEWSVESSNY